MIYPGKGISVAKCMYACHVLGKHKDYCSIINLLHLKQIISFGLCRWCNIKALLGATRLIKHMRNHEVPMALASNSPKSNIKGKISFHQGIHLVAVQMYIPPLIVTFVILSAYFGLLFLFLSLPSYYLCYLGWKESFSVIIGGDEVAMGKPSPEM